MKGRGKPKVKARRESQNLDCFFPTEPPKLSGQNSKAASEANVILKSEYTRIRFLTDQLRKGSK